MDEIARRRPVDRTAARVTQPGPKGLESAQRIDAVFSATPLPMRPVLAQLADLTGLRCGQLTVIGLSVERASGGSGGKCRWVCRCVCGYYVTRNQAVDRCDRCRHTEGLQRETERRRLGLNKPGVEPQP